MPLTTLDTPDLQCDVDRCPYPVLVKSRKLCRRHYNRWQRYGTPHGMSYGHRAPMRMSPEDRFFWYVIEESGHWMWTGPTIGRKVCDYGRLFMGDDAKPRHVQAHRWAFEFFVCEIPPALEPDHMCEIQLCVYPWHMDLVPHAVNVRRGRRWR